MSKPNGTGKDEGNEKKEFEDVEISEDGIKVDSDIVVNWEDEKGVERKSSMKEGESESESSSEENYGETNNVRTHLIPKRDRKNEESESDEEESDKSSRRSTTRREDYYLVMTTNCIRKSVHVTARWIWKSALWTFDTFLYCSSGVLDKCMEARKIKKQRRQSGGDDSSKGRGRRDVFTGQKNTGAMGPLSKRASNVSEKMRLRDLETQKVYYYYSTKIPTHIQNGNTVFSFLVRPQSKKKIYNKLPVLMAAYCENWNMVKTLMNNGWMTKLSTKKDASKDTVLGIKKVLMFMAALDGKDDIVSMLINQKLELYNLCQRVSKLTPLHVASVNGHVDVVKILLENGSKVYAQTLDGKTAMSLAIEAKMEKVVEILSSIDKIRLLQFGKSMISETDSQDVVFVFE